MQFFMSQMNSGIRSMMKTFLRKFNRYTHETTSRITFCFGEKIINVYNQFRLLTL